MINAKSARHQLNQEIKSSSGHSVETILNSITEKIVAAIKKKECQIKIAVERDYQINRRVVEELGKNGYKVEAEYGPDYIYPGTLHDVTQDVIGYIVSW